jgi:hypothetical protein
MRANRGEGLLFTDTNARITIEQANRIAQQTTGGEMSVVRESECIQLCRKGYVIVRHLHQELDLTESGIRLALQGWEAWPANQR